jgi:dTDP-4-dehydrorhamnose reductase
VTATDRRMFVLGHRGMLGHVVGRYATEAGWEVLTSPLRYAASPRDALIEHVRDSGASVVVNCLGLTKQRSDDRAALYLANAVFPVQLAMRMRSTQYLVHASTDCVFAGVRGNYQVDDECDATDAYGFSKLLGEGVARLPHVTVVRVSVVGPDRGDGRGLLAWFLRQPVAEPIPGYVNHRWNGITTLDWATIAIAYAEEHVRGGLIPKMAQPGTEPITKYELLCAFRDALAADRQVAPVEAPQAIDRTLVPTDRRLSVAQQLRRLAAWYPLRRSADT